MPNESQVAGWPGRTLFDADGTKVGKIEDVFADARTGRPAWATVSSGLFGRKHHFVPIESAREVVDGIAVPVAGQLVRDAPRVDEHGELTVEDERQLYRHYGIHDTGDDRAHEAPAAAAAASGGRERRDDRTDEHGATEAGERDAPRGDERREAVERGEERREATAYRHRDERTHREERGEADLRDDRVERREPELRDERVEAREPGLGQPGRSEQELHAEAADEARARAERERLAADEAERDRVARGEARPAAPPRELHVLDRDLAQEDLSVAPASQGEPAPVAPSGEGRTAAADVPPGGAHHSEAGTGDAPSSGSPGAGTRLRRLVRSMTPTKDDHHG